VECAGDGARKFLGLLLVLLAFPEGGLREAEVPTPAAATGDMELLPPSPGIFNPCSWNKFTIINIHRYGHDCRMKFIAQI
jgi:hypothetical protein